MQNLTNDKIHYLYRAINENDLESYNKKSDISAVKKIQKKYMKSVGKHIANGSKVGKQDCWISTSKSFRCCAEEFSIPQMGNYNTAVNEKEIIVIDPMWWRKTEKEYCSNGNLTVFIDKDHQILIDLGDIIKYPLPILRTNEKGNRKYNEINGVKITSEKNEEQMKVFVNAVMKDTETGILDLTYPTKADRGRLTSINQFSLLDYHSYKYGKSEKLIDDFQGYPIVSGQVKDKQEVLILNYVPYDSIVKKLSKIEKEVLYCLCEVEFNELLDKMTKHQVEIVLTSNGVQITNDKVINNVNLTNDQYRIISSFLVDIAIENCKKNNSNLDVEFRQLKDQKIDILNCIVKGICTSYKVETIIEEAIEVRNVSSSVKQEIEKKEFYDMLAIQYNDTMKIHYYKEDDYDSELNKVFIKK